MAELNHTGAFASVEPIKGDTTDWVGKVFKPIDDYYKEEREKKKQAKKDLTNAFKNSVDIEIPEGFKTNSVQELLQGFFPELLDAGRQFDIEMEQARENGDLHAFNRANQKKKTLNNSGAVLKSSLSALEKRGQDITGMLNKGTHVLEEEDFNKLMSFGFDNIKFHIDKNSGETFVSFQDINGDGIIDENDKQSYSDFLRLSDIAKNPFGNPIPIFDIDKNAKNIGSSIKSTITSTLNSNGTKRKITDFNKEELKNYTLTPEQIRYMKYVDKQNGRERSNEEYNQEYQDKIFNYIKQADEISGGGSGGSGSGKGKSNNINYGKRILYNGKRTDHYDTSTAQLGLPPPQYHSLSIAGYFQLDDKISGPAGKEISASINEICLYDNGEIELRGSRAKVITDGVSMASELTGGKNQIKEADTYDIFINEETEVTAILSQLEGFQDLKTYKQMVVELKKIIREGERINKEIEDQERLNALPDE